MNIRPQKHSRGFTLIEVMVSLFLFGMVVSAIYATWTAVVRGAKTGRDAAAMAQRSRMAARHLETALTSARSFAADPENYSFVAENGNDASLEFTARLPRWFPRDGKFTGFSVRRVMFALEGRKLVLRQRPILMDMDQNEQETPVVLARNVNEFALEFWDRRTKEWVDEWILTNQLPLMVRFTLRLQGAESGTEDQINGTVSLPAIMVQPGWQMPGYNPPRQGVPRRGAGGVR